MELLLILALITIVAVYFEFRTRTKREISQQHIELEFKLAEIKKLQTESDRLRTENERLTPYKGLLDIEGKGKEIISKAEESASSFINNANEVLNAAKSEAERIRTGLAAESLSTQERCKTLLNEATQHAAKTIDQAKMKAIEISGEAIAAKEKMEHYEKTAKAMKNIVKGYGNKYLVPTYSLLDDLADEFGHTEAGEKLKSAREESKRLIKLNIAAKCDYAEASRRGTAINFVLDAFNGKVDSILSKVKKDNYGTMRQKILDAFHLVNNNGKAFRNAVIDELYLNSRLEELRWAVATHELKFREQEEQRRIREQIREEEKAKRDFEKAIREAQKEEQSLKKLLEKAQKEAAEAGASEKAALEEKLHLLEQKLKEAEEKNVRALSMAQQTKSGNVYVISNIGSFGEDVYKIGLTRRLDPLDRVRELGDASVPFEFDVHAMIYSEDAPALERELHKKLLRLQINKVNPRKEFFRVTINDIKELVESMNITAKWTMIAEAKQYHESLAVEKAILADKNQAKEWEKHQMEMDPVGEEEKEEVQLEQ